MRLMADITHLQALRRLMCTSCRCRSLLACSGKSAHLLGHELCYKPVSSGLFSNFCHSISSQANGRTEYQRKTQPQPVRKPRPTKPIPVWMKRTHQKLMKSVKLPQRRKYLGSHFGKDLTLLTTTDLLQFVRGIKEIDAENMPILRALWQRLDDLTCEEMILVADLLFMNDIYVPIYTSALISHITEMFELLPLTPLQMQRFALHVAHHGHRPPYLQMMFEQYLLENIHQFHVNDVLLWCQFFFMGRAVIKSSHLLERISEKVLRDFKKMEPSLLPPLLKNFRLSAYTKVSFYKTLGDLLVETEFFRHSRYLHEVMHFAYGYASVKVTHPRLFLYILQECLKKHRNDRLKDISKIIWSCGRLMTDEPKHVELIVQILERLNIDQQELLTYPDTFVDLLMGLAYMGLFPEHLVDRLFQPEVIRNILELKENREKQPQLLFLYNSIKIERPNYSGALLSTIAQNKLKKKMQMFNTEMNAELRKSIFPAVDALREELGSKCVVYGFFLPHVVNTDIVLCYNKSTQKFVPPKMSQWQEAAKQSRRSSDSCHHIVLMLLSKPQSALDNKDKLLGQTCAKLRQLRTLGHQVIVVPAEEALDFPVQDLMVVKDKLMSRLKNVISQL